MIQVPATTPLFTNTEAAVWLRLCEVDAKPGQIEKAVRKLHALVRDGKLRPLASSSPYTFTIDELRRHVEADTEAFTPRTRSASDTQTEGKARRRAGSRGNRTDSHNGSNKETQN